MICLFLKFLGQQEVLLTSAPLAVYNTYCIMYMLTCHVRLVSKEGGPQFNVQ